MRAVVMAGGEGTRLRPLTSNQPKPMVPICGKPCIEHIVELVHRYGIDDVVVTLAFMPQVIRSYLGDGSVTLPGRGAQEVFFKELRLEDFDKLQLSSSFHLKTLSHAQLVHSRQEGRFIFYSTNYEQMSALLSFLTENCCGGQGCSSAEISPRKRKTS